LKVIRHSNLNHLESAGVGLEITETPGKKAVNRKRPLGWKRLNWFTWLLIGDSGETEQHSGEKPNTIPYRR
jgi:hypothetical protein